MDSVSIPYGKGKENFTEQLENSINVSIPNGKGKAGATGSGRPTS